MRGVNEGRGGIAEQMLETANVRGINRAKWILNLPGVANEIGQRETDRDSVLSSVLRFVWPTPIHKERKRLATF